MSERDSQKRARLAALEARFVASLPERFERIMVVWERIRRSGDEQDRAELLHLTHGIVGSAGSFGQAELGDQARIIDDLLRGHPEVALDPALIDQIDNALQRLEQLLRRAVRNTDSRAAVNAPIAKEEAEPSSRQSAHPRILIVEDQESNRELMRTLLDTPEWSVELVEDGERALERVRSGARFELILMDLELPGMSGFATLQAIRTLESASPHRPECPMPIIAVTGHNRPEDAERCRSAGFDGHLAKPVDAATLLERVTRSLSDVHHHSNTDSASSITDPVVPRRPACDEEISAELDMDLALRRVGGDEVLLARLLHSGLRQLERSSASWAEARGSGDRARLGAIAHELVSVAGTIGAERLLQAARGVDQAARSCEDALTTPLLVELETRLSAARTLLHERLSSDLA